jgi:Zn-dependent peptidase ImmA (M78 family)
MPETNRFVQPRTRADISILATAVRTALHLGDGRVAMAPLLEIALPEILPDYEFLIVEDHQMPGAEGFTDLSKPIISMPQSVYDALLEACPRARFTAAHELGHLLMHSGSHVQYARAEHANVSTDPEWQANEFAGAFLMPEQPFRQCRSVEEAVQRFGVGYKAAQVRANRLQHRFRDDQQKKGRKHMARAP